jgi:gamma-glutamylcyclotransferase (GGCT)/AIG2-like uncharacterized protein YtfP
MSREKLFVYGTLRKGFPLHRHLAGKSVCIGTGTIRGLLYDLGSYPGAVASNDGEVHGELYELQGGSEQLKQLDQIEGFDPEHPEDSLFLRAVTEVQLPDGASTTTWVYLLPAKPASAQLIPGGDYLQHR